MDIIALSHVEAQDPEVFAAIAGEERRQRDNLELIVTRVRTSVPSVDILIVDDSSAVRGVVRKLLTQLGYRRIEEASYGAAALAKIGENHFDLVISDWNMEPMNGQELLKQVRGNEKYEYLPFIMMTADVAIEKIIQAKQDRVSCFINKPFCAAGLQAKISQINAEERRSISA